MSEYSQDQIWANEGGIMVRFFRKDGEVQISILDVSGNEPQTLAQATLTEWRWRRAVQAMKELHTPAPIQRAEGA